jgi:hydroxyacylglutathione hydrolase
MRCRSGKARWRTNEEDRADFDAADREPLEGLVMDRNTPLKVVWSVTPEKIRQVVDMTVEPRMMTGLADVDWIHGAADCGANADPLLQVYRFDADTIIIRENKCYSAEGNFMYLLVGTNKAILFDTGAVQDRNSLLPRADLPIGQTVRSILAKRSTERQQAALTLTVAHTHSHRDHVAWDGQFHNDRHTTLVGWPDSRSIFDLGGRKLDIIPIPGHEEHHIAAYAIRGSC